MPEGPWHRAIRRVWVYRSLIGDHPDTAHITLYTLELCTLKQERSSCIAPHAYVADIYEHSLSASRWAGNKQSIIKCWIAPTVT